MRQRVQQRESGLPEHSRTRRPQPNPNGFTLIELVITLTVLTILTMGVIPLVKLSVRRQREQRLREVLREMRLAIDQFHRDVVGGPCWLQLPSAGGQAVPPQGQQPGQQQLPPIDPRTRVMITDCTIFGVDNPDRYPPDLETLTKGVNVAPRAPDIQGGGTSGGGLPSNNFGGGNATDNPLLATKRKVYLRSIPVDPITGEASWDLRSSYDSADASSWGGENVFDVRSKAKGTALNGEEYSDW